MLGKKDEAEFRKSEEVSAFLGKDTTFEGKLLFEGLLRLDGKCQGEILSGDSLVIGDTGEVTGQINVGSLTVNGRLTGQVIAKRRIEIAPPGEIRGDIETASLVVREGASFHGNCKMEKRQTGQDEKISFLNPKAGEAGKTEEGKMETEQASNKPPAKHQDASRYSQGLKRTHGRADQIL